MPTKPQLTSKEILHKQRKEIADNKKYLREQEELIAKTVEVGNNHIRELTLEADELQADIHRCKMELIDWSTKVDNKRLELLGLN